MTGRIPLHYPNELLRLKNSLTDKDHELAAEFARAMALKVENYLKRHRRR